MPEVRLPDGSSIKFPDNMSVEQINTALAQFSPQQADNPPPPGVIIHEADRSYVVGPDGKPAQTVTTKGMEQTPPTDLTEPAPPNPRNEAAAALAARRDSGPGLAALRPLTPFFQGLSMGYGDEAVSAAKGLRGMLAGRPFGESYNLAQEAQRQELAQERNEHPYRSTALQVGGALTQLPALGGLYGAGAGAAPLTRAGIGAATGAGMGALEGFGSGSGLSDRLTQGTGGALLGGVIGGAAPLIGQGLQAGTRGLLDYFTVNRNLAPLGLDRAAADSVMRGLATDDALRAGGAGATRIAEAGPQGMLADAGPAVRAQLDTAIQRAGPGAGVARDAVNQRGTAANLTLRDALDTALGAPQGVAASTEAIRLSGAPARRAAYDAAYATPIDYAGPLGRRLERDLERVPAKVIARANELMEIEGNRSRQVLIDVADDGTISFRQMPDVRQLDYITRAARNLAESGETTGALGARTDLSRAYTNLAGDIRSTLRRLVPAYGTALDTAADDISRVNAVKLGERLLSPSMARDEVAIELRGMGRPELDAVRQGLRSHIDELQANVRAAASDPNQDARQAIDALKRLNSEAVQDKLAMVLDPLQLQSMQTALTEATRAAELYAGTARNSATYGRMAIDSAIKAAQEPGPVGSVLEGRPLQATQRALQFLSGRRPQDKLAREDEIYTQIAELLTGRRGPNALTTLGLLSDAYRQVPQNAARARAGAAYTAPALGILGYQSGRDYLGR